jgi:hypothetical protein
VGIERVARRELRLGVVDRTGLEVGRRVDVPARLDDRLGLVSPPPKELRSRRGAKRVDATLDVVLERGAEPADQLKVQGGDDRADGAGRHVGR